MRELKPGDTINNRYTVVRKLGAGAMGSVYLCEDPVENNIQVALKVLISENLDDQDVWAKGEYETLTRLRHPNLARVYNFGKIHDSRDYFIVSEFIKGVDLSVDAGEFTVFVGPSGCGKSTLLRMIAGLEDITSGDLEIGGVRMNDVDPSKRGIAMVFQSYALYPHMTVRENMGFSMKLRKAERGVIAERVKRASQILGLDPYLARYPKQLSGGQRQRVALARALYEDADLLVLDEVTTALDREARDAVATIIASSRGRRTVLLATHDRELLLLCDRVVYLEAGAVAGDGRPGELARRCAGFARILEGQAGRVTPPVPPD